jgi:pimeloyl-ACP methyl ester carboxylesterase
VMAQLIPHGKLVAVPECGHMCTMERPDAVSNALAVWLKRVAELEA